MSGKKKSSSKHNNSKPQNGLHISNGRIQLNVPIPRIPRLIGSLHRLSSSNSVYPHCLPLDVPLTGEKYAGLSGAIAQSIAIGITRFSRYANFLLCFREWAIVGAKLEITVADNFRTGGTAPLGWAVITLDEKSSSAPTFNESSAMPHCELMLNSTNGQMRSCIVTWKPQDFLDLEWQSSSSTAFTPIYCKIFSSPASTYTASDQTTGYIVTGSIALCFRGLL